MAQRVDQQFAVKREHGVQRVDARKEAQDAQRLFALSDPTERQIEWFRVGARRQASGRRQRKGRVL